MEISIIEASYFLKPGQILDKTAIVVDAMRSAATIITALTNGADRIIPVMSANDVLDIKRASEGNVLSCGEISAVRIPDFDLGNSPSMYTREAVQDKVLIFSTTNGSIAIKRCESAAFTIIGTFVNATAAAKRALMEGHDIMMVCAGTKGRFSTDDIIACGCLLDRILKISEGVVLDDFSYVALELYHQHKDDLLGALAHCKHVRDLIEYGLEADVEYCLREDVFSNVPIFHESVITV